MGFLTKLLFKSKDGKLIDVISCELEQKLSFKKKAIEHAIDLIARTISKCEIEVYKFDSKDKRVKRVKNDTYYKLNVKPNDNEIASTFMYNVVLKLLNEQEALIISMNKKLYLADSFDSTNAILHQKTYKNIKLSDYDGHTLDLSKSFSSSECIYLSLGISKINECLTDYYNELGKLIAIQCKKYINSNLTKWKLTIPGNQPKMIDPLTNQPIDYEAYKQKLPDGLTDENDSIVMLGTGFALEKLANNESHDSADLLKLQEKWEKEVATAFNIPLDVFYGSKTDKSTGTTDFITFAIMPIISILEDGFNSALISKDDYINGEMIKINKLNIKHFDIFDCSGPIDKLISSGFSNDECRYFLGIPETGEKWAQKHHITKNYANVSDDGGDNMI